MMTAKEQGGHNIDRGKVKTNDDINVTAMDQLRKDYKLKNLPRIDFTIWWV